MTPDEEAMFEEFRDELESALQDELDKQYYEELNPTEDIDYGVAMTPEEWDEYEASLEQEKKDYEEFLRNEEIAEEELALALQQEENEKRLAEERARAEAAEKERIEQERKALEKTEKIESIMRGVLEKVWEDVRAKKILPRMRYYCTDKDCAKKTDKFSDECRACFENYYVKKLNCEYSDKNEKILKNNKIDKNNTSEESSDSNREANAPKNDFAEAVAEGSKLLVSENPDVVKNLASVAENVES